MQASIKSRIKRLEEAQRPPEAVWSIAVDIIDGWSEDGRGRVVGHIPAHLIEPGQPFDYRRSLDELAAAMGYDDAQLST